MDIVFLCQYVILLLNSEFMLVFIFSRYGVFIIVVCAGAFLEAIENLGFDYIASGHYAHVVHPSVENTEAPSVLQLSKDKVLCASPTQIDYSISSGLILMLVC